jgi:FdhD protein
VVTPARRPVTPVRVRTVDGPTSTERPDRLVTEEPLEIRVHGPRQDAQPLAVTMRTPGHDFELAVGFLTTEQLAEPGDVASVAYCLGGHGEQQFNVVTVALRRRVVASGRTFAVNASCGLCGATTLDDALRDVPPVDDGTIVARSLLVTLPDRLREQQQVFDATGGLHAAGLFTTTGEVVVLREDVGRHNALDKVVGHLALHDRLPARDTVLAVSGRVSYEIVQKAAVAGIPVLCAVSAPSSLAVDAARRVGQTVVGFLRGERFNVYTAPERIDLER